MFCKSKIFHIDKLIAETIQDADYLFQLVENTVTYLIKKSLIRSNYNISDIYCNRVKVYSTVETFPFLSVDKEPEYRELTNAMEKFIDDSIDNYYIVTISNGSINLNIECGLINRHTVFLSFDLYRGPNEIH